MKNVIAYAILFFSLFAAAQEKDHFLPEGNKAFAAKKYAEAEKDYRLSNAKAPKKAAASYNLGNTIYNIGQTDEAGYAFLKASKNAKTFSEKHKAFHNLGNVFMKSKQYGPAVEAYKQALVNDPTDEETRYNYALAKDMLKKNPPKKNDKDKDKKKDKDKDKKDDKKKNDPKKDGDKDKDKKDGKDQKDKGKPKDSDKGQPKPKEGGISQQRMKNLLDAVNNEEKKVQDKMNGQKVKGKPVQTDKDW